MNGKGFTKVSADGAIGTSGEATAIYGLTVVSGATPGVVILRDGTGTSDAAIIQVTGTANTGKTVTFGGKGIVFPSGCYYDEDANVTYTTVFWEAV